MYSAEQLCIASSPIGYVQGYWYCCLTKKQKHNNSIHRLFDSLILPHVEKAKIYYILKVCKIL
jgi:hypothetical protein